jgi:hypothetical protein
MRGIVSAFAPKLFAAFMGGTVLLGFFASMTTPGGGAYGLMINASEHITRIAQGDPKQYIIDRRDKNYQITMGESFLFRDKDPIDPWLDAALYSTWNSSTCSTSSMTMVINSFLGSNFRISDILRIQSGIGKITAAGGLIGKGDGIKATIEAVNKAYGLNFTVSSSSDYTLDDIIAMANQGQPIIVDLPGQGSGVAHPFSSGGHYLVVIGGDDKQVQVADSSGANHQWVPREQFLGWWDTTRAQKGLSIIVAPKMVLNLSNYVISGNVCQANTLQLSADKMQWVNAARTDAKKYGLSESCFVNQINQESGFNSSKRVVSRAGAQGIAQFMPGTAQGMGIDPWNPTQALDGAARLMKRLFDKYNSSAKYGSKNVVDVYMKALAAYNCGSGCVDNRINEYNSSWGYYLPCETWNYIKTIVGQPPSSENLKCVEENKK